MSRQQRAVEGKRYAKHARIRHGLTIDQVAAVLQLRRAHTRRRFDDDERGDQITYGDMFLLARDPSTGPMLRDMLAPLLELTDPGNLRLSDLDRVTITPQLRAILKPTIERIHPVQNGTDTREGKP